jgi:hypothetical protein
MNGLDLDIDVVAPPVGDEIDSASAGQHARLVSDRASQPFVVSKDLRHGKFVYTLAKLALASVEVSAASFRRLLEQVP